MRNLPMNRASSESPELPDELSLYRLADEQGVDVYWYPLGPTMESLAVELSSGEAAIAIDPGKLTGLADEKYKLAHELGHSFTGAFYCRRTPLDEKGRCEQRADRWAIEYLLPLPALKGALSTGRRTVQELAEYFDLPEPFILRAVAYYTGPKGEAL